MIERLFPDQRIRQHLCSGPLASYLDGFATVLTTLGYAKSMVKEKLRRVADLSRWLQRRELAVTALDEQRVEQFLTDRRRHPTGRGGPQACRRFLSYLRQLGCIPPPREAIDDSPLQRIEHDFAHFLASERGLKPTTVINYVPTIHRFLEERYGAGALRFDELSYRDVHHFLLRRAPNVSRGRAKLIVTALRSFFGFLHQRGDITTNLAGAIPAAANWRLTGLPRSLTPEQVENLLASCDLHTPLGLRDYAILLLLARLGLRAGELVALTLDDLDWETGTLLVHGKGERQEHLPLPQDVGKALENYLCHARPQCSSRRVFIRCHAPLCGFSSSAAIDDVVRRALARTGLDPAFKGAHLLRHSLATRMLRNGASLAEIGEILRHRHPETTQIYAKVDLSALRALAPPWPGDAI